jgi:polyhydroxyalkanoate synthesis regulator phasin
MFETLDKLFLAGLGAVSMTKEKAERLFDEYIAEGKSAKETTRSGFVKELMDSAERTRKELNQIVAKQVRETVASLDLATQEDIARLEGKLDKVLSDTES